MVANLSKTPVIKTPEKGKDSSVEKNSTTSLSSPTTQFFSKEGSDNIDLPNSGSKTLNSVQLFGKIENHQNNPSSSRVLNSSPSFPPIQRKGSTDHSPKTAAASNKTGLPDNVKSGVEQLSGVSLSDVKVHYNSPKPAQLQAHAYAQGTDIHVASGQEKHVPHEAWHVVQQKQGRVQATKQMKGKVPVNDDAGLEKEADVMGAKAVQMKDTNETNLSHTPTFNNTAIQLVNKEGEEDDMDEPQEREAITSKDLGEDEVIDLGLGEGAERATSKEGFSGMKPMPLFHTVTWFQHAKGVMHDISDKFDNPASRFGGGFYSSTDMETNLLEIEHHKYDDPKAPRYPSVTIIFENVQSDRILDCSSNIHLMNLVQTNDAALKKKCIELGYDGIYFKSLRGPGCNIVLFTGNRKQIMGAGKDFMKHTSKVQEEGTKSFEVTNSAKTESVVL